MSIHTNNFENLDIISMICYCNNIVKRCLSYILLRQILHDFEFFELAKFPLEKILKFTCFSEKNSKITTIFLNVK